MKIRSIRPEFFADPTMAELSHEARLLYIGLWCYVDDDGRGEWLPKQIDGLIFPMEDVDIHALLEQLVSSARIVRYTDGDRDYFHIPTFTEYQKPNRKYDSKLPDPAECQEVEPESGDALPTQRGRTADSHAVEGEGEGEEHPSGSDRTSLFQAFYEFWFQRPYSKNGLTQLERGRINKAVKQAAESGITPDDVTERGERYRRQWSELERTPQALLSNWTRFEPETEIPPCDTCENKGRVGFTESGEPTFMDDARAVDYGLCPTCHPKAVKA